MYKKQKNGFTENYFCKTMTNLEHMPHSPTPTYTGRKCQ